MCRRHLEPQHAGDPDLAHRGYKGVGTISAVRRLLEYGVGPGIAAAPPGAPSALSPARRRRRSGVPVRAGREGQDGAGHGSPWPRQCSARRRPPRSRRRATRTIPASAAPPAAFSSAWTPSSSRRSRRSRSFAWATTTCSRPGASPPSVHALIMLAHMPLYRSEHYDLLDRLYTQLSQPQPRQEAATMVGSKIVLEPHLVLGDPLPHRNAADADMPSALFWLEIFARLGFLRRNDKWTKLYERLIDDCDSGGVWHPPKRTATMRSDNPVRVARISARAPGHRRRALERRHLPARRHCPSLRTPDQSHVARCPPRG